MKLKRTIVIFIFLIMVLTSCSEKDEKIVDDIKKGTMYSELVEMFCDEGSVSGSGNTTLEWHLTPYIELVIQLTNPQFSLPLDADYPVAWGVIHSADRISYYEKPLLNLKTIDEYNDLISHKMKEFDFQIYGKEPVEIPQIPKDFICYDKLTSFGDFLSAAILSPVENLDYDSYMYSLVDSNQYEYGLYIDKGNLKTKDFCKIVRETKLNKKDLRTCSENGIRFVEYAGAEYTYIDKKLSSISWKNNENTIAVVCSGNIYSSSNPAETAMFSDYPINSKETVLSKLLSKDTAADMIEKLLKSDYFK